MRQTALQQRKKTQDAIQRGREAQEEDVRVSEIMQEVKEEKAAIAQRAEIRLKNKPQVRECEVSTGMVSTRIVYLVATELGAELEELEAAAQRVHISVIGRGSYQFD